MKISNKYVDSLRAMFDIAYNGCGESAILPVGSSFLHVTWNYFFSITDISTTWQCNIGHKTIKPRC